MLSRRAYCHIFPLIENRNKSYVFPFIENRNKLFYIYTQLIVFLIVVLHAGLGPDVVVLVPNWYLLGTPRSARLCG